MQMHWAKCYLFEVKLLLENLEQSAVSIETQKYHQHDGQFRGATPEWTTRVPAHRRLTFRHHSIRFGAT